MNKVFEKLNVGDIVQDDEGKIFMISKLCATIGNPVPPEEETELHFDVHEYEHGFEGWGYIGWRTSHVSHVVEYQIEFYEHKGFITPDDFEMGYEVIDHVNNGNWFFDQKDYKWKKVQQENEHE